MPRVDHRKALPARLLTQCATQPVLAHPCWSGDQDVLPLSYPAFQHEAGDLPLVQASTGPVVNILPATIEAFEAVVAALTVRND